MKIGTDIIEISRIKKLIDNNKYHLDKIFTQKEIQYSQTKFNQYQHFAARFSGKEAIIKALNDKNIPLNKIEIYNLKNGKSKAKILLNKYKNLKINISLSHSKEYAIALVIIED